MNQLNIPFILEFMDHIENILKFPKKPIKYKNLEPNYYQGSTIKPVQKTISRNPTDSNYFFEIEDEFIAKGIHRIYWGARLRTKFLTEVKPLKNSHRFSNKQFIKQILKNSKNPNILYNGKEVFGHPYVFINFGRLAYRNSSAIYSKDGSTITKIIQNDLEPMGNLEELKGISLSEGTSEFFNRLDNYLGIINSS